MNARINGDYRGTYKVWNFQWGYLHATFDTLKQAKAWIASKCMRCDHKRGSTDLYAAY